jgi:uncharacterized protein (TIGR03545 family)
MKGLIRWSGIGVAAVVVAIGYFLLEPLLKFVIEQAGTRALSTKVTLESVEIGWSDASLSLNTLEVADKKQPMRNQLEVEQIALSIEAFEALSGHLVSDNARLSGIRFNTPRSGSGDVGDIVTLDNIDEKAGAAGDAFSLPGLDLPDMDTLVSKENSLTYQRYQSLKQYIETNKETFEQRIDALKDDAKIDGYKARFKEIKNAKGFMGKLQAVSKAKDLKSDIDKDFDEIKQLRKDFDVVQAEIRRRAEELKNSPQEEADHLLAKVGVDGGTQQVAEMLFGPELKGYLKQLKSFTSSEESETAKEGTPIAERGKGVFVSFEEEQKLPLVWFKQAEVSGDLHGLGIPFSFKGDAMHVTDQQTLTGQPTVVSLDLLNERVDSAKLGLILDLRKSQKISIDTTIKGYTVESMPLSGDFDLEKGSADIDAKIKSVDQLLSGSIAMNMSSVSLNSSGATFEKYPAAKQALSSVDSIQAKAVLSGSLDEPGVSIQSNLDTILSDVLNKALEGQLDAYKQELTGKLEGMLSEEMGEVDTLGNSFSGLSGDIAGTEKLLDGLLGGL